jgi:hypothetical protein
MDSIINTFGQEPSNQEFKAINSFEAYCFNTSGFDSLNQIYKYETHYYFKQKEKNGSLKFTMTRAENEINKPDSTIINTILNSIKRNE